jgi:hypothetical protein
VHVLDIFGEIRKPAGRLRDLLQRSLGSLGVFLALFAQQPDGVDLGGRRIIKKKKILKRIK